MRKIGIACLALIFCITTHAQITYMGEGMCKGGIMENFSGSVDYVDPNGLGGLFWWEYPNGPFYKISHNPANHSLDVQLGIYANRYEPMGVSFGNTIKNGQKVPNTLDFSNNFDYQMQVKNNCSTTIIVRMTAVDINGKQLSLNGVPSSANAWMAEVQATILPGEIGIIGKGTPNGLGMNNTGTFLGGSDVSWNNGVATVFNNFDNTKVTGFNVIVIDGVNNPPHALNGQIQILKLTVGDISCLSSEITGVDNSPNQAQQKLTVFPNPVNEGVVYFNETIPEIYIYNAVGELVKSAFKTEKVLVGDLDKGIYSIKSSKGSSIFILAE